MEKDFLSRTLFQRAFWDWLASRPCDEDAKDFSCPICGGITECPIIVMDGTELAFPRRWQLSSESQYPTSGEQGGSRFQQRVLVPDAATRGLLERFADRVPTRGSKRTKDAEANYDPVVFSLEVSNSGYETYIFFPVLFSFSYLVSPSHVIVCYLCCRLLYSRNWLYCDKSFSDTPRFCVR